MAGRAMAAADLTDLNPIVRPEDSRVRTRRQRHRAAGEEVSARNSVHDSLLARNQERILTSRHPRSVQDAKFSWTNMPPQGHDMNWTRREFIGRTGLVVGAAGLHGCAGNAGQREAPNRPSAAPGVTLNADGPALPDYSHDLERYLVRLANEARERRKHIVDAISTRQQVVDRQTAVVA